jgi:hypothetical protein
MKPAEFTITPRVWWTVFAVGLLSWWLIISAVVWLASLGW